MNSRLVELTGAEFPLFAFSHCRDVVATEAETSPVFRDKMVAARSRDTVRSRGRTGKPARQLKSAWTDDWYGEDSPGALAMPLQGMISEPAIAIDCIAARVREARTG